VKNSFEIAIDEANKAGGVAGMKIVSFVVDDKNDPTEASNAANLLIHQQKVKAIIGSVTSKASIPVSDLAQSGKIPTLSPTATNPKVTVADGNGRISCSVPASSTRSREGDGQVRPGDAFQEKSASCTTPQRLLKGIAEYFSDAFKLMGGKVVAYESYGKDDVDFSALLTKVKASGADVLFLPDYYNKVGLIAKQARRRESGHDDRTRRMGFPGPREGRGSPIEGAIFPTITRPTTPAPKWSHG
jgi:branched-chain amino acid transport system substrate-binding protein